MDERPLVVADPWEEDSSVRNEPAQKLPPARVGSFEYLFATAEVHWSAEVAAMHGYPPAPMTVDVPLVLSHKHDDDKARVSELYSEMVQTRLPFSSKHRIVDCSGATHQVVVISKALLGDDGSTIGLDGFYVDLSDVLDHHDDRAFDDAVEEAVDEAVAEFTSHRSVIEQAKGMVMLAYSIPADRAFDVLKWRSQQTNVKIRTLCELIVKRATDEVSLSAENRSGFDQILLSAPEPGA